MCGVGCEDSLALAHAYVRHATLVDFLTGHVMLRWWWDCRVSKVFVVCSFVLSAFCSHRQVKEHFWGTSDIYIYRYRAWMRMKQLCHTASKAKSLTHGTIPICVQTPQAELNRHAWGWKTPWYFWTSWLCTQATQRFESFDQATEQAWSPCFFALVSAPHHLSIWHRSVRKTVGWGSRLQVGCWSWVSPVGRFLWDLLELGTIRNFLQFHAFLRKNHHFPWRIDIHRYHFPTIPDCVLPKSPKNSRSCPGLPFRHLFRAPARQEGPDLRLPFLCSGLHPESGRVHGLRAVPRGTTSGGRGEKARILSYKLRIDMDQPFLFFWWVGINFYSLYRKNPRGCMNQPARIRLWHQWIYGILVPSLTDLTGLESLPPILNTHREALFSNGWKDNAHSWTSYGWGMRLQRHWLIYYEYMIFPYFSYWDSWQI